MAPTDREFEKLSNALERLEERLDEKHAALDQKIGKIQSTLDHQQGALAVWKFIVSITGVSLTGVAAWVMHISKSN